MVLKCVRLGVWQREGFRSDFEVMKVALGIRELEEGG